MALPTRKIEFSFQDRRPAENILKERFAGRVVMPNVGELRQRAVGYLDGIEEYQLSRGLTNEMKGQMESLQRQLRSAIATKERLQSEASGLTDDTSKEYYATLIKDVNDEMNKLRYEIEKIRLSDEFFKMSKATDPKEIADTRNQEVRSNILKETPAMALVEETYQSKKLKPDTNIDELAGAITGMRIQNETDPNRIIKNLQQARELASEMNASENVEKIIDDFVNHIPERDLRNEVKRGLGKPVPKSGRKKKSRSARAGFRASLEAVV